MAATAAADIYAFVTESSTDLGYRRFYNRHHHYLDLPEPSKPGKSADLSKLPILKGTTGSVFFLKSQTAMGVTAFGIGNYYEGHAFIIFRGTNKSFAADILTDLSIGNFERSSYGHRVHNGFANSFKSVKEQVKFFLSECTNRKVKFLHCIGHSLGGALATLCAEYAKSQRPDLSIKCYTFGSPRVGGKSFSDDFTRNLGPKNIFRAYHRTDLIPCIPCWPYMHVPTISGANYDYFLPSEGDFASLAAHDILAYGDSVDRRSPGDWKGLSGLRYSNLKESDIEPWINNKSPISFTPTNLEYLDKAINYVLLKVVSGIGNAVLGAATETFTFLDRIAWVISKGIDLSKNMSGLVLSLLRKIAEILGMRKTISAAEATLIFIRNLFQRLHQKVSEQARKVLDAVLVNGKSL